MRRFTRLTNGFSKKVENHAYQVALHFMHYNFARIHKTLRVTPAMEAGVSDRVWKLEQIADLVPALVAKKRGPYKKRTAQVVIADSSKRARRSSKKIAATCGLTWFAIAACVMAYLARFRPSHMNPLLFALSCVVFGGPGLGQGWMILRSYTLERRPHRYILIAAFVPFSFIWYYLERAKGKGMSDQIR